MKRAKDFPQVLLCRSYTDMRKQSNGLAEIVESYLGKDPFAETLFVFCNRRKDIIKALYFDKSGFCLWTKKLDQARFPWIKQLESRTCIDISARDLELLFDGVDVFKRHKKLKFTSLT